MQGHSNSMLSSFQAAAMGQAVLDMQACKLNVMFVTHKTVSGHSIKKRAMSSITSAEQAGYNSQPHPTDGLEVIMASAHVGTG